jgi:hypothetical protein
VLCDTYSFSSSRAVTVALVHVRYGTLIPPRGVLTRLRFVWRLFRAAPQTVPTTSRGAGIALRASLDAASFTSGVRSFPGSGDDLLFLWPPSMRHMC